MRKLAMGCAVAAMMALSVQSEAIPPAPLMSKAPETLKVERKVGLASWYGMECHGNTTASGEVFDMNGLTAAHRKLPMGTRIRVTNLKNQKSLVLRVNDRGPGIKGRLLDVSMEAARRLGFLRRGLAHVQIEILGFAKRHPSERAGQGASARVLD